MSNDPNKFGFFWNSDDITDGFYGNDREFKDTCGISSEDDKGNEVTITVKHTKTGIVVEVKMSGNVTVTQTTA